MGSPDLPHSVACIFRCMDPEKSISERERRFFTDNRLSKFWGNADKYLSNLRGEHCEYAPNMLIGCFIGPHLVLYGKTWTRDNDPPKVKILKRLKKVDQLLDQAAIQANSLYETLRQLDEAGEFIPSSMMLEGIVRAGASDAEIMKVLDYPQHRPLYELLVFLAESLEEYQRLVPISREAPGMKSNKSTWRDWLAEARSNLGCLLRNYPGEFNIREADWVTLVNVLIDDAISRESVHDALRGKDFLGRLKIVK